MRKVHCECKESFISKIYFSKNMWNKEKIVVLDNGSRSFKGGFAGEEAPR